MDVKRRALARRRLRDLLARLRGDPVGYAREVLGVSLTADQEAILRHLHVPPCRVLVPSGHNVGKTFIAAVAVNYWYDCFNPGAVLTLGPRLDSLKDTVWGEVRLQRARARVVLPDDFIGPSAAVMQSAPDHWAKALTAAKDASLTGRHLPNMLFLLEEACAIEPIWWEVCMSMYDVSLGHAQLCIFNPTDTTSQAYLEDEKAADADGNPRWHRFRLSALEHPNIKAELAGQPRPVAHAVSVRQVAEWISDWTEPLQPGDVPQATDVAWPPGSGRWYRPGPRFEARCLGLWPSSGSGVWGDALWNAVLRGPCPDLPLTLLPEIGCDTATGKGEDFYAALARWGPVALEAETSNTMDPVTIAGRLREIAGRMADLVNRLRNPAQARVKPQHILIKVDDDGVGRSVAAMLARDEYAVVPIGAGTTARYPARYPRRRDELWFEVADRAKAGGVYLGLLPAATLRRLKQQLMAPVWQLDNQGRRQVEKKDDTKEKIGRSPDEADALNLSYLEGVQFEVPPLAPENEPRPLHAGQRPDWHRERQQRQQRR